MRFLFAFSIFYFSSGSIFANNCLRELSAWYHVTSMKNGDLSAEIDFRWHEVEVPTSKNGQGIPASTQALTHSTWINLRMPGLRPSDQVKVMVINYFSSQYRGGTAANSQALKEYDLTFAESGRFTGELEPILLWEKLNDGYGQSFKKSERVEVVIWINGHLYKNPSDGRNLGFNFTDVGI